MNIPESPYQRLIDIIDVILVKNETTPGSTILLHPKDVSSLPPATPGSDILGDFLKQLESKGVIPKVNHFLKINPRIGQKIKDGSVDGYDLFTCTIPRLDKAAVKKLLAERQSLYDQSQKDNTEKISLAGKKIDFDDDTAIIKIGNRKCGLPAHKNGHYLCRVMFAYKPNEPVDWSVIYKEMSGSQEDIPDKKFKKTVQDTMYWLNDRVKDKINTDDSLFDWDNKTVRRNF